ncbi:MAG: S-methyl-5-thioribose-1-phosphate isomerase [Deltaproteobacteria bacterium]|nr:S-methyl-5-thioribose-1-phosphate isomerase [Deltaproteobacteria bacterium]
MYINGKPYRTISRAKNSVEIIDQTSLPFKFCTCRLNTLEQIETAITTMQVRGAPLIGVTAAYGVAIAVQNIATDEYIKNVCEKLLATRPTAVNLAWALNKMQGVLLALPLTVRAATAWELADQIAEEDVKSCKAIGEHGLLLLRQLFEKKPQAKPLNILTHCNAGWLATVDFGTALAPIYLAHDAGLPVHVWVDETRPRNQGASLTAWELGQHGIAHTIIADNTGGHLMQSGEVDLCIVGADRIAKNGDVCNKIGTYLKALAAFDNQIPFYVAAPQATIDLNLEQGVGAINIEERSADEVHKLRGIDTNNVVHEVRVTAPNSKAKNFAFDVTPARLISGIITEGGVLQACKEG